MWCMDGCSNTEACLFFASFDEKKIILFLGETGKALPGKSGTNDYQEAGTIPALFVMEQKKIGMAESDRRGVYSGPTFTGIVTLIKSPLYSKPCLQKGTESDLEQ